MATTERIASPTKAASFTDSIIIATSDTSKQHTNNIITIINKGAPPSVPEGSKVKPTFSFSNSCAKPIDKSKNNPHKLVNSIPPINNDINFNCTPSSQNTCDTSPLSLINEHTNRDNNTRSEKFVGKNVSLNKNNILSIHQHTDTVVVTTLITTTGNNGQMETLNTISKYNCVPPSSAINRVIYKDSVRGEKKKGKFLSKVVDGVTDMDNKNISSFHSNYDSVKMSQAINSDPSHAAVAPLKREKESRGAIKKEYGGGEQATLLEDEEDPYAWGEFGGVGDLIIDLDANIEKSLCNINITGTVEKEASTVSDLKIESNSLYQANGDLVASKSSSSNLKVKIKRKNVGPPTSSSLPTKTTSSSVKGCGRNKITNSAINNRGRQPSSPLGYNESNTVRVAPNASSSSKICLHKSMPPPHPSNTASSPPSPSHPRISSSNGYYIKEENACDDGIANNKLVVAGDIINYPPADNGKLLLTHTTSAWLMNGPAKRLSDEALPDQDINHTLLPLPPHSGKVINSGGGRLPSSTNNSDSHIIKTNNNSSSSAINRSNAPKRGVANDLSSVKFIKQQETCDSPTPPSSPLPELTNDIASPKSSPKSSENAFKRKPVVNTTMSPGLLVGGHSLPPNQSMCLKLPHPPSHVASRSVKIPRDLISAATLTVESDACNNKDEGTSVEEHLLGPCEPGTVVSLNGVVWQENTASGMLVVNITWRGLNYVGTLMDTCKVKWAPPKLGAYNHHASCGSGHKQHHNNNNAHHLSSPHNPCTPNRSSCISNNPTQHSGQDFNVSSQASTNQTSSPHLTSGSTIPNNCCNLGTSNNNNLSPSMAAYNMGGRVKRTRAAVAAAAAALASALAEATKTDSTSNPTSTTTTTSSLLNPSEAGLSCDAATSSITQGQQHQLHCSNASFNHQSDQGLERCNFYLPQSNSRRSATLSSPRQAINSSSPAKRESEVRDDNPQGEEGVKRLCLDPQAIASSLTPNTPEVDSQRRADVKCPVRGCFKSYASKIAMEFHLNRCHDQAFSEQEWQSLSRNDEPTDEVPSKSELSQDLTIKEEFSMEIPEISMAQIEASTSVQSEIVASLGTAVQQAPPTPQLIDEANSHGENLDNHPVSSPMSDVVNSTNSPAPIPIQSKPQPQTCVDTPTLSKTQSGREVIDPSDPFSVLLTDPRYREQMGLSLKSSSRSPPNLFTTTTGLYNKMSGRQSNSADSSTPTPSQQQCINYNKLGNDTGGSCGAAKLTYQLSQDSLVHTLHKSQANNNTPFQDHLRMLQLQSRLDEPGLAPSSFGHRTSNLNHPYYFYDPPHPFSPSHPSSSSSKLFPNERYKLDRSMSGVLNHQGGGSLGCGGGRQDKSNGSSVVKSIASPSNRPRSQTPPGPYDFVTGNEDLVGKIRLVDPLSNGRTAVTNRTICANAKIPSPHSKFPNTPHQGTTSKLNGPALANFKRSSPPHGQGGDSSSSGASSNFSQYLMPPLPGCVGSIPPFSLHQQLVAATANYPSNMNSIPFPSFNNYSSPSPAFHYFPGYPPIPDPNSTYNGNQGSGSLMPAQMMDPYMAAALFANQHETMAALAASGLPGPFYHLPMAQHGPSPTPTPAQPSSHHYNK